MTATIPIPRTSAVEVWASLVGPGRLFQASAPATRPTGTLKKNTPRQFMVATMTAAIEGPATLITPQTVEFIANTRARWCTG